MATWLRRNLKSQNGQSLIELTFIAPLMIALTFGAIEVGSIISTYLTLTHTTREGANLTSRGETPSQTLDAIIAASSSTLRSNNQAHWKLIYSRLVQDKTVPCPDPPTTPCVYRIESQIVRGGLVGKPSKLSGNGSVNSRVTVPGINSVRAGQTFHALEVFYNYNPYIVTFIGRGLPTDFYDRTIFTNVTGTVL
jgi:hypothetical protein